MTHWLEEAEKRDQQEPEKPKVSQVKVQQKIDDTRKNYDSNKEAYDSFINSFFSLCQRANNLPPDSREPWGIIEAKARKSKMNSHLFSFQSRERFDKRVSTKSFPFMKMRHYKHIRKIMVSVSKDMGMANVEVYENYLAKTKMNMDDGSYEKPPSNDGLDRFHFVYHYPIKQLNDKTGLDLLDWLVCKNELKHLPFKKEDIKRLGKIRST